MNITKEESIKWINHVIAFYASLGRKQKEVAVDFGLPESRLSDLKNPNKPLKLTPNQIEKIRELCGAPRSNPGRFEHAELYDDLTSFLLQFVPVTRNRYLCDVYKSLKNQDVLKDILKHCLAEELSVDKKIERINQLVRSQEFEAICIDSRFWGELNNDLCSEVSAVTQLYDLHIKDQETIHGLRQLYFLVKELPEFQLGTDSKLAVDIPVIVPEKQLVVTGNRIAAFMHDDPTHFYPANEKIKTELADLLRAPRRYDGVVTAKLDQWKRIRVEVYLSENMNYHILIHLTTSELNPKDITYCSNIIEGYDCCNYDAIRTDGDRIAVIQHVSTLDIFNVIDELRKWQGLSVDNLYELKQSMAQAGGHIAGAIVLG
ncbi:TPA: XRE family transcriptional regulator [Vibrio vulnificus]|nr:XRE family transcriptional regulator [Vibrio vulnificus]